MGRYVLVIDEGTTGTRALIFDQKGDIRSQAYTEFTQYHPAPDRVEHDAVEIWEKTLAMCRRALQEGGIDPQEVAALGITNQRATTVIWDRETGRPVHHAIVWQDLRTADYIEEIREQWGDRVYEVTGWALSPVYSSLMIRWILKEVPGALERAREGKLLFGTIDTWLIWNLTGGKVHATGYSNASVTGSYDIRRLQWYEEWLDFLGIPMNMLPEVRDDSGDFGHTDPSLLGAAIPIASAVADQHAALFGQGCREAGTVKCTHGTGTFLDMNIGSEPAISRTGINTVIAWKRGEEIRYALEGYAAVTGSAVQWLRDGAQLIQSPAETEALARSVEDNGGVYFVPALTGLSAPYWDSYARGMIIGITRGTTRAHLVRACLEGIVYSTRDFLETMARVAGVPIGTVKVDGGASRNDFLLQFQADLLQTQVVRPATSEATSLGAALLAGLAVGFWKSPDEVTAASQGETVFNPQMDPAEADGLYRQWTRAVGRTRNWANPSAPD